MGDFMHFLLVYVNAHHFGDNLLESLETMLSGDKIPMIRIHSECLLGDALGSDLCDCGEQLDQSIKEIMKSGSGLVMYLRQEGRGIGMRAKLACLAAQEGYVGGKKSVPNMTPDEANRYFGYDVDERDYGIATRMLRILNIQECVVNTGNGHKIQAIQRVPIAVKQSFDIPRDKVVVGSRKHRELCEKVSRNYNYGITEDQA
jgi:GTP cyclohydrolase II